METQFPVLCSSKPLKPELEKFQRIPITSNVFRLGRGPQNTVVMPDKCLSKDHCIFEKVEDNWILENCSYASIKVNGNKLRKGQKRKLHDQDIIKLDSSNEFIYTFNKNTARKKRKLDENHENVKKKFEEPSSTNKDKMDVNTVKQHEVIMLEQSRREKQIYNEYASRIEKLKGSKRTVKRQKADLKVKRDTQLASVRVEMAGKMASLMAQAQQPEPQDKIPKEPLRLGIPVGSTDTPKQEALYTLRARIREQARVRVREKKELRKLRKETEQLRLDREKKLKELEKQKQTREKELQEELNKLNKKLAKQIEMHETEKRRAEQLLSQQREQKVDPATGDSAVDMESELLCSICSELFVRATTLGCAHSFCQYCIRRWRRNKQECPICRASIGSECRSIVLDSLVDKMTETSEDAIKKRQELVKAREELEERDATNVEPSSVGGPFPNYYFQGLDQDYYEDTNSETNSSYYGRESSLEPDPDMLVMEGGDDEEAEGESSEESFSDFSEPGELVDERENYVGESSAPENYDEHDNSAPEEGDSAPENYDEGEHSAPENYDEGENSASENYDEGEQSASENNDEGEHSASENNDEGEDSVQENYDEGEQSASENYDEDDHSASENNDEGENSAPENYDEGENSAPENYEEGEHSAPENYDEGEHSAPENYDEGEHSASENYDEGEHSAPEYGDEENSYPEHDDDYDNDDYYYY